MALYHFSVSQIKRSAGQSALAAAAYRAGERLYSEYYDEISDYTRKGGVLHTEILLSAHAPECFRDRATFWNAVEAAERHPKAQLAYSFDIALQNELSLNENIELARAFVQKEFVDRGMIADLAIHSPDKVGGIPNPHMHVMTTMRPLNPDGSFAPKQRREYVLDASGNRIRGSDGRCRFNAVHTTDWHSPERLESWRTAWCNAVNAKFEEKGIPSRIDHRSYARQSVEQIPTVHEGPNVRKLEQKGIRTEKGELNRWIRSTNRLTRALKAQIAKLTEWINALRSEPEASKTPTLWELVSEAQQRRYAQAWSQKGKVRDLKQFAETVNFLQAHQLFTLEDLSTQLSETRSAFHQLSDVLHSTSSRICELEALIRQADIYAKNKPIYENLNAIHWKSRRDAYAREHDGELRLFYAARRILKEKLGNKPPTVKVWKEELETLRQSYAEQAPRLIPLRNELLKLSQVRHNVDLLLREREERHHSEISR